uniref:Uncharacterized protein n=1 Tax=Rhizophora mucronata TaxID=61149 RepID=A0A2P2Q242_RHIMU
MILHCHPSILNLLSHQLSKQSLLYFSPKLLPQ